MIKIVLQSFTKKTLLNPVFSFCAKKISEKTSADITANFTDKAFEQTKDKKVTSGRSWKASQLRIKSTEDLHKLWFVCIREKNLVLADELASQVDPTYQRKAGKIYRVQKVEQTMRRILFIINEREQIKKQYRQQLEEEYIEKKRQQLENAVQKAPQPLPQITYEMLRAKYSALRKGIDNVDYLEKMFSKHEQREQRFRRADQRVQKLDPERQFQSFWQHEMTIGERPTQMQILKSHVKNWKSLNLRQRKIILGFLNARRSKDAKAQFRKELKILGQKLAFEQVKNRTQSKGQQ